MPDIQHEYRPEFFQARELEERRRLYTASAKQAVHVCAISEFTRQTLIQRLGLAPERVTTTQVAADPSVHPREPRSGEPRARAGKARAEVPGRTCSSRATPGRTDVDQEHPGAARSAGGVRAGPALGVHRQPQGRPRRACSAPSMTLVFSDRVRFLGYCPPSDMPALYEGAAALVFPSLFEGFGMPLVEAMWCDCPIVCSNDTSLPESRRRRRRCSLTRAPPRHSRMG